MQNYPEITEEKKIFHVSELNYVVRDLLENNFSSIWIEGEISNLSCPSSGHMYFTLKDAKAQVRCAMFKGRQRKLQTAMTDGMQVIVRASVSLYEQRGDYQLIVEYLEEAGDGLLQKAFSMLKKKLHDAGIFDNKHKLPLPAIPNKIGIITSPTGAAIRDIISVLKRRFPAIPVVIYPTQVQGKLAAEQIIQALDTALRRQECDVLILARGGGSLEDLWSFNDENLAYKIFAAKIPIVTGIGHEVDFTIADFVADHRAPTPSAAAEVVSPDQLQWLEYLWRQEQNFKEIIGRIIQEKTQELNWLLKGLQRPDHRLREKMQLCDHLEHRLISLIRHLSKDLYNALQAKFLHLTQQNPAAHIQSLQHQQKILLQKLTSAMAKNLNQAQLQFSKCIHSLEAVSPLATLERGYAIVTSTQTQKILRSVKQVKSGDNLKIRLVDGQVNCTVIE